MILRPLAICLMLAAALTVCSMAFRASEKAAKARPDTGSEMARLQESRAYYEGRISETPPVVEAADLDLPSLPEVPAAMQAQPKTLAFSELMAPAQEPLWKKNAVPFKQDLSKAKIVIIIDDMGMDKKHTREAMALTAPVTFSWLPYATNVQPLINESRAAGHETIVHVPMEPENGSIDAGPTVLKKSMSPTELSAMLDTNFSAFTGYVGFNNHMGSKLTQDSEAMQLVMADAAQRGILFVDSRTAPESVADQTAAVFGMPHVTRDVFLDHAEDMQSVKAALARMEAVAKHQGYAVGIGHPKDITLAALREWLPTLAAKGLELAPVSAVVKTSEPAAGTAKRIMVSLSPDFVGPLQPPVSEPLPY